MDLNIVARIKSFILATESTIEFSTLYPGTKLSLVAAGNEGNFLIEELTQENNNDVNLKLLFSYNQTSIIITQVWYLLLTYHFNIS